VADDFSPQFQDWRARPERSAAAAVIGMTLCWCAAAALVLGMVEIEPGTASVSDREFLLWMAAPVVAGVALCSLRRARFVGGAVIPGLVVGWLIGWVPMLLILALSWIF
jgi:hypothetical protein